MLILACAPLGNPGDATTRLREVITSAKFIAAEDSRKLTRLAHDLGIVYTGKVISYFEGNESERLDQLAEILESGEDLLVITDAGAPGVSDPGYRLIRAAIEKNIEIKVLPGPSAPVTALLLSGAPTDRFCFEGFTPRTSGTRKAWFEDLAEEERTIIFFEAPHRLKESLLDACEVFGVNRMGAICREMTKTYEETIRGTLGELLAWSTDREILGEITIVLHGFDASTKSYSGDELVNLVLERESAGMSRKDAIGIVAKQLDLPKRQVFDALVAHKSADKI
jgi:16S rRNA (cytidine1402-2'-O)-methyltransferase